MNLIEQAKSFATRKHVLDNGQVYGELLPYTHHLADVERALTRYGFTDDTLRAASWLHDVIEDTRDLKNEVKRRVIDELFGEDVGTLVWAVTSEEGANRKTRNALTYPKIRAAGYRAVALKLADRIANVEYGGKASGMYVKEHPDFQHGIYIPKPVTWDEDGDVWDAEENTRRRVYDMQCHLDRLLVAP